MRRAGRPHRISGLVERFDVQKQCSARPASHQTTAAELPFKSAPFSPQAVTNAVKGLFSAKKINISSR
jgi:hypothetical protein